MTYPALDRVLLAAGSRLDHVRQDLYFADVNILSGRRLTTWHQVHGSAFVHIAACLEISVKEMLRALVDEINAVSLAHCDLRTSLFSLVGEPLFDSLAASSKPKMAKRVELMELTGSTSVCLLNNTVLPLDGRTLRAAHFDLIWFVFGLPFQPLPHQTHRLALASIADSRNDVAHGEMTAEQVARRQPIPQTLKLVEKAEEVLINLHTATETYLTGEGFVR